MKKIGIMGTESTGKTTFALQIKKNFNQSLSYDGFNIEILGEIARQSPGKLNKYATVDNQLWIHYSQYTMELSAAISKVDILICDRTILDSLIYSHYFGMDDIVEANIENAIKWMETYDILYFKRPFKGILGVDDGIRSNDPIYRKEIDILFSDYIDKYDIDVVESF